MQYTCVYLCLLRVLSVFASDIVSEERDIDDQRENDHMHRHQRGTERRFLEELDDKEWHVSHLKDNNFLPRKNECKEESLTDRINNYRKTLREDPALVEYVSADALPVDETDLVVNKCIAPNFTDIIKSKKIEKDYESTKNKDKPIRDELTKDSNIHASTTSVVDQAVKDEVVTKQVDTATTAKVKSTVKQKDKVLNATDEKTRRASEYQFSSVEYYDEVDDIDESICPEFVEVVELEIDHLRNYDVECEQTLEWRSLE